jgi:hypothetical protein
VRLAGLQGMRAGRENVLFGRPGLRLWQQRASRWAPADEDLLVYRMAGLNRRDVGALYTYDVFSPLVWFVLDDVTAEVTIPRFRRAP